MRISLGIFCFLVALNLSAAVTVKENSTGIVAENEFIRVEIVPRAGKITSFYDKKTNRELLSTDSSVYGGACKSRDMLFQNIEPMMRNFQLETVTDTPEKAVITATFKAQSGNIDGMELIRTYTLHKDWAYLKFEESWRSHSKPNQLVLNWHNAFALDGDSYFYLPSKRGMIEVDSKTAVINRLNLIDDPAMPWLAMLNRATGQGVALYIDNIKEISGLYVWGDPQSPTMEVNFHDVSLKPIAESDVWSCSGKIIPLCGVGHVASVSPQAVLSADTDKAVLYFSASLGSGKITLKPSGKIIEADFMAGSSITLPLAEAYSVTTSQIEFLLPLTTSKNEVKPLTIMPERKIPGVNGFYYYYPELYLSDEISTDLYFGLRGDFSKFNNFRLVLTLPSGVELLKTRFEILKKSESAEGTVYEIHSFRKTDFFGAVAVLLKLNSDYKPGSVMYLNAAWDGGSQKPEKISLEKIPPMPKPNGLKYFKTLLYSDNVLGGLDRLNYSRIGINHCDVWDYGVEIYHKERKDDSYYSSQLNALKDMDVEALFQLGLPFSCGYEVAAGRMLEGAGRLFHPDVTDQSIDVNELRCVNINGEQIEMICPSYRGRYFEKCLDMVKIAIDYGFDNIAYDEETWGGGATICYCARCKEKYQAYLKDNGISASDEAFWEFKTDQVADIYRQIRETLDTYKPKPGIKRKLTIAVDASISLTERHYGSIRGRLTDWRKLAKYADEILPMVYTEDSEYIGDYAETATKLLEGSLGKVVMLLSPNRVYEYAKVSSQNYGNKDVIRDQILESIFGGAKGVAVWNHRGCFRGANGAYKFAQAVEMLLPVEEIIAKGTKVEIKSSNPAVKVTAYDYNGEMAIFARNYDAEVVKTQLELPEGKRDLVFDKERIILFKVEK